MSPKLPVISGQELIKVLEQLGWYVARQRGSHVRLKHSNKRLFLTVPLHREIKRGTLSGILADAGLEVEKLRQLL